MNFEFQSEMIIWAEMCFALFGENHKDSLDHNVLISHPLREKVENSMDPPKIVYLTFGSCGLIY